MDLARPRLAPLHPSTLDPEQQKVYQAIVGGDRANGAQLFPLTDAVGCLRGPFNAMLLSPSVGLPLQALGSAIRYRTALTGREREIAILAVAAHWGSAFELEAHLAVARHEGLTDREVEGLTQGSGAGLTDERERAVHHLCQLLLELQTVDDEEYGELDDALGAARLYEITVLVGYYSMLALQLRVFGGEG